MRPILIILISVLCGYGSELCEKVDPFCNCDAKCSIYGDCCPGHEYFDTEGLLKNILTCKSFTKYASSDMWVVDKCRNPKHKLSNLCTKTKINVKVPIKSYIPVMASSKLVYENLYCARCNGENTYSFLNISIECTENKITSFQEANRLMKVAPSKCLISKNVDKNYQRFCKKNFFRLCPKTFTENENITENCKRGNLSIMINGISSYRNKDCCECWNTTCFKPMLGSDFSFRKFTYALNFNEWNDDSDEELQTKENDTHMSNRTESRIGNNILFYTAFVFTSLSMISLSFLIILYTTQRIFHNFGGYLTICLGLCLWLMNFFTLLVTSTSVPMSSFCKYIAIFQHFIALSTFVWMAVYALDLLQTFGIKSTNMGKKKSLKTFCLYCATGFGCVTLLVGTSTILDYSLGKNSIIRPKYGGPNCWFTSKIGGIVWYFAPVCLMLLWNFGSCVIVFYRLIQTANECRVVQRKESNSTLWLCIRLTAVFGIGYIFQIFAIFTNVRVLIIIGSLINCLQGCLLTFCFVWAKRVRTVVSNTWSSLSENYGKSTNTGSTSRTQNTNLNDDEDIQMKLRAKDMENIT